MNDQIERTVRSFIQGIVVALVGLLVARGWDVTGFLDVEAFAAFIAVIASGALMGALAWVMAQFTPAKNNTPAEPE